MADAQVASTSGLSQPADSLTFLGVRAWFIGLPLPHTITASVNKKLACLTRVPHVQHMAAGAVAGITEHVAMYPVDTIKTRMQALAHPGQRVRSALVLAPWLY